MSIYTQGDTHVIEQIYLLTTTHTQNIGNVCILPHTYTHAITHTHTHTRTRIHRHTQNIGNVYILTGNVDLLCKRAP